MGSDVLGSFAEGRIGDNCDFPDFPVVIPHEFKVADGRCHICPPGKVRYLQKQAVKPAGSFDEGIHCPGQSLKIISPQWTRRTYVEQRPGFVEIVINHLYFSS